MAAPNITSFSQPMEGQGAEMGVLDGFPAEVSRDAQRRVREQRETERQASMQRQAWRILQDLQGEGGVIAQRLLLLAIERLQELCTTDEKLGMLFAALGEGVFAQIRQGDRLARESALAYCAMLLGLPAAPLRAPQVSAEHEVRV